MFGVIKRLFKAKVEATKQQIDDWNDPDEENKSMPCNEILIPGIDKPLHDRLMTMAVSNGATFEGDKAMLHGVALNWTWDEPSGNLHVTPLAHPWYFTCEEIQAKIEQIVDNAKKENA